MSAPQALAAGATYLVVGRPVHRPPPIRAQRRADRRGAAAPRRNGEPVKHLVLYSRPGCHLCEEMKAVDRIA